MDKRNILLQDTEAFKEGNPVKLSKQSRTIKMSKWHKAETKKLVTREGPPVLDKKTGLWIPSYIRKKR